MPVRRRRRWPYVTGGIAVVLVALAAAVWFVWVPGYRPHLHRGEHLGIDVSAHQGRVNWRKVRGDGITFAYIKASEGGDFVDRSFAANWAGARAAGVERGAYHFFTLCTPGAVQAEHFLRTALPEADALPPAVDLELKGNCKKRPDFEILDRELRVFLQSVEAVTHKPTLVYIGSEFEQRYPQREQLERPIWHQRFLRRPDTRWTVWQVQGFAHVAGVGARVDLDVLRR